MSVSQGEFFCGVQSGSTLAELHRVVSKEERLWDSSLRFIDNAFKRFVPANRRNLCLIEESDNSVLKITRPSPVTHSFYRVLFSFFLLFIRSFFILSVLRKVHSLFPKWVLRIVRSTGSSCSFQYPLCSLRSFSSCLLHLTPLPVTSILPSIVPSITCIRRQFLQKIWPIQLAFLLVTVGYFSLSWLFVIVFHFWTFIVWEMSFLKVFGYIHLLCHHIRMSVLWCSWTRQLSRMSLQALYATNLPYPGTW